MSDPALEAVAGAAGLISDGQNCRNRHRRPDSLVAHHDDPGLPIVMLSPEIPEQVLKSVILAALLRLETK